MPQPPAKHFSGIFISYRRDDSSGHAGRLFDRLVDQFGQDRIFMDIDTIEYGEDFVTVIENAVGSCEILIAIIGRNWLSGRPGSTGPLNNPNDFVRLEIAAALSRNIRVIPVLVQGATMPRPQDLPEDVSRLSRRNALELSDTRWRHDVDQLISALERILVKQEEARSRAAQEEEESQRQQEEARKAEESLQLAETTRREREERERSDAEEKRRPEAEAAERRQPEEPERREIEEARKRRADEERAHAEAEANRRAEEEARLRHVEAEQETESSGVQEARAEKESLRQEAERRRVTAEVLQASSEKKHSIPGLLTVTPAPHSDVAQPSDGNEMVAASEAGRNRRAILFVSIAFVVVVAIVVIIWMRQTPKTEQPAANRSANSQQTGQKPAESPPQPPPGMVYVPGGEFTMGRKSRDPMETPRYKVRVEPFFIDMHEVSNQDYKKFLDANPAQVAPANWVNRNYGVGGERKPVTGVSWDDASAYAAWSRKRLPTEEEWELAARGTDGRVYPWGKDWKPGLANTGKPERGPNDGASGMMEVGSYKEGRSPYGAYDMIGNAWEWTASEAKTCSAKKLNSTFGSPSVLKVIRGGSWASKNDQATTTFRRCYGATGEKRGYSYTGFRSVQSATVH